MKKNNIILPEAIHPLFLKAAIALVEENDAEHFLEYMVQELILIKEYSSQFKIEPTAYITLARLIQDVFMPWVIEGENGEVSVAAGLTTFYQGVGYESFDKMLKLIVDIQADSIFEDKRPDNPFYLHVLYDIRMYLFCYDQQKAKN